MKIFPTGAWFGLTRSRIKRIGVLLFILVVSLVTVWLSLYAFVSWKAHQASELAAAIQSLTINQSTLAEARSLTASFHGSRYSTSHPCTEQNCTLCFGFSWFDPSLLLGHGEKLDRLLNESYGLVDNRVLNWLGIRLWKVWGSVDVRDNRVSSLEFGTYVEAPGHYWMLARWRTYGKIPWDELDYQKKFIENQSFSVHWTHLHVGLETGEGIVASVAQDASLEDRKAAQHIELRCLATLRPCRTLCDFFPEATRYEDHLMKRRALSVGQEAWQRCGG